LIGERRSAGNSRSAIFESLKRGQQERQTYPLETFATNMPKEIEAYANKTLELMDEFERFETVDKVFVRPMKTEEKLKSEIAKTIDDIQQLGHSKGERGEMADLVLSNMRGRLEAMATMLSENDKGNFDYVNALKSVGIEVADVEAALRMYKQVDAQKIAENLYARGDTFEPTSPESENQAEMVRDYYIKFLRRSFEMAPAKLRKLYGNKFENYMKTVNFIADKDGTSYERTDTIYLNIFQPHSIVNIRKGERWVAVVNLFLIASVVAEEGLLGHQGHFLISENSKIPPFMKRLLGQVTNPHAETMVRIGEETLINELKRNRKLTSEISDEDFALLERYSETQKQIDGLGTFMNAYVGYVYFASGKDVDKAAKATSELSGGDETFKSETHKNRLQAYFNGKFWEEYKQNIGMWAYVTANLNAVKFEECMKSLTDDAKKRVLEQMLLGYWPPSSLNDYFDFLVENELRPKEALRS
jgi:hypothetical protein